MPKYFAIMLINYAKVERIAIMLKLCRHNVPRPNVHIIPEITLKILRTRLERRCIGEEISKLAMTGHARFGNGRH